MPENEGYAQGMPEDRYELQFALVERLQGEAAKVARRKGELTPGTLVAITSKCPKGSPMEVVDVKPCPRPTKHLSDLAAGRQPAKQPTEA